MGKEIHIFDLDDTLLGTPTFAELINTNSSGIVDLSDSSQGNIYKYLNKIKKNFYLIFSKEVYFKKQGDFIVVYNTRNNTPLGSEFYAFIQDASSNQRDVPGLKKAMLRSY